MAAAPGQEKSGAQGGEGGHGDQTEGADDGVDDLRRHILVVQDVVNRVPWAMKTMSRAM